MKNRHKIETAVLSVYRRVSPSYRPMKTKKQLGANYCQRANLLARLGLPEQLFKGKKLLDIGGGTGEKSLFYSKFGAEVTILEPNEISRAKARAVFKTWGHRVRFIPKGLFDIRPSEIGHYDLVMCDGVLHNTYDPQAGLRLIASNLKKRAVLLIAVAEHNGWFKRLLQRELVFRLAGANEAKIVATSKKYFQEHLDRAVKFGLRTEDSVIFDTFVNPQIQTMTLKTICDILHRNRVRYLSSYPTLNRFHETRPWSQDKADGYDYAAHRDYYKLLETVWKASGEENVEETDLGCLARRVRRESKELEALRRKIRKASFRAADLRPIQKGYLGVGLHFFTGCKG